MIRIVDRNGKEDWISPKFLDILLYLDQVQMFERADGWAVVGVDPLRSMEQSPLPNQGTRRHQPTPLPPAPSRDFLQRYLRRA